MASRRPVLALVHSPLVGAETWQRVAGALRARGHETIVPSLTEVFRGPGPYYPRLTAAVVDEIDRYADGGRVVLVGHSGAGALLPAAARATAEAVEGLLYVDALLPHPGRCWFETAPEEMTAQLRGLAEDGLLPPWNEWFPPGTVEELLPDPDTRARFCAELPRLPLAYFEETAPEVPGVPVFGSAYLRLSEGYADENARAERAGWRVAQHPSHHLAMLTEPAEVSARLAELVDGLEADQRGGGFT
ncbi:alpha/beta fold hydrolase [Streptomyces oceani]|uniref:AB hydrolase-1 domain-containing protein n=1 Tax=Streptomyces oceani TaxID=1075402 RepID=A0A1E7JZC5_9ACTN|nr:alpha/beta fold hydrolase [Streptomyces oceani]OEU97038.1 hypothetical protein AN216_17445 [Streptomyces oceani]